MRAGTTGSNALNKTINVGIMLKYIREKTANVISMQFLYVRNRSEEHLSYEGFQLYIPHSLQYEGHR